MSQEQQAPTSTDEEKAPPTTPSDAKTPTNVTGVARAFQFTIIAIVVVATGFLLILGYYGLARLTGDSSPTLLLGILTAAFGAVVGLIGTYFGVKASSEATAGAEALAASGESQRVSEAMAQGAQQQQVKPDIPHQIRLLTELRESGVISDDEFREKNLALLNRMLRKEHK